MLTLYRNIFFTKTNFCINFERNQKGKQSNMKKNLTTLCGIVVVHFQYRSNMIFTKLDGAPPKLPALHSGSEVTGVANENKWNYHANKSYSGN